MKTVFRLMAVLAAGLFWITSSLTAISFSGNSLTRFGQGKEGYRYFENLSSLNIYEGNYRFYLQYELSNPPEFGLPFQGIRKRWIEYAHDSFSLRFGNIYTVWGKGLSLNLFDDQGTDYDNTVDGVYFTLSKNQYFQIDLIGGKGKIRNIYPNNPADRPNRVEKFDIYGGRFQLNGLMNRLDLGFSYLWSLEKSPYYQLIYGTTLTEIFDTLRIEQRTPGFSFGFHSDNVDFYTEGISRIISYAPASRVYETLPGLADTVYFKGKKYTNSLYSSLNVNLPYLSCIIDYKRYAFDVTDPESRKSFPRRPSRISPYQNPPIVQKEHEWLLTSRYMHIIDFNDEVGFQVELQSSPTENITLLMNISESSRNAAWMDTSSGWENEFEKIMPENSYLPAVDDKFMPFQEYILGGELYLDYLYFQIYFVGNREIKEYEESSLKSQLLFKKMQKTNTIPGEIEYIMGAHSLAFKFEFQDYLEETTVIRNMMHMENLTKSKNKVYNRFLQITYSLSPYFSVGMMQEISSKKDPASGDRKVWKGAETVINLTEQNQLILFFGSERGGIRCSSGICVPVPPIVKGARVTLSSRF